MIFVRLSLWRLDNSDLSEVSQTSSTRRRCVTAAAAAPRSSKHQLISALHPRRGALFGPAPERGCIRAGYRWQPGSQYVGVESKKPGTVSSEAPPTPPPLPAGVESTEGCETPGE